MLSLQNMKGKSRKQGKVSWDLHQRYWTHHPMFIFWTALRGHNDIPPAHSPAAPAAQTGLPFLLTSWGKEAAIWVGLCNFLKFLNHLCQAQQHNHVTSLSHLTVDLLSAPPHKELGLPLPSHRNTHLCLELHTTQAGNVHREKIISEKMFIGDQPGNIFLNISTFPSKHTNNSFINRTQSQHPITVRFALPKAKPCFPLQSLWAVPSLWLGKVVVIKSRKEQTPLSQQTAQLSCGPLHAS